VGIGFCVGCNPAKNSSSPQAFKGPRNVLLVTLDTTRADNIGCYGNAKISTPTLDGLASGGLRVQNTYASVPMTFPSHASMLTGQYPFTHGVRNNTHFTLGPSNITIAEVLHDAGWRTGAFIGATILEGRLGLNQGFDKYCDDMFSGIPKQQITTPWASRKAGNVNYDFMTWLDGLPAQTGEDKGWFAWVHYYDPHFSYSPPEPYYTQYASDLYIGEIAYVDHELGLILDELKSRNLYDNTLVIAVGDHGEGLAEHNELFHALWAYNSTLRVPLIISAPENRGESSVIEGPASVIDVYPTILAWCGAEVPASPGVNLLAPDAQATLSGRGVYFESMEARISYNWAGLRGLVRGSEKYIHTPIPEYYDLGADPGELGNLCDENRQKARELKTSMYRLVDQWRPEAETSPRELSSEDIARLQSLGYLTGGAIPATAEELEKIEGLSDLKSMADVVDDVGRLREEGDAAFEAGDYLTAGQKYRELLKFAEVYSAVERLGEIATYEGDEAEAIRLLKRSVELGPTLPLSWYNLGVAYRTFGSSDEARSAFEQAVRLSPSDPVNIGSYVALAVDSSGAGNWDEALKLISTAREIDKTDRELVGYEASIRYQLGLIDEEDAKTLEAAMQSEGDSRLEQCESLKRAAADQMKRAFDLYTVFLSAGEGNLSNYFEAGQCAIRQKDFSKALEWTRRARSLLPKGDPSETWFDQAIAELERRTSEGQ